MDAGWAQHRQMNAETVKIFAAKAKLANVWLHRNVYSAPWHFQARRAKISPDFIDLCHPSSLRNPLLFLFYSPFCPHHPLKLGGKSLCFGSFERAQLHEVLAAFISKLDFSDINSEDSPLVSPHPLSKMCFCLHKHLLYRTADVEHD